MNAFLRAGLGLLITEFASHPLQALEKPALFPACDNLLWGYVDRNGIPVHARYEGADDFSEGLALVQAEGQFGYINAAGKKISLPPCKIAGRFSESLAIVWTGSLAGYANQTGAIVIAPRFESAGEFSDGLAAVKSDGKWGYCDKTGNIVIPATFDLAGCFSEGLAPVGVDGRMGAIDRTGELQIKPAFKVLSSFSEGLALFLAAPPDATDPAGRGKWGWLDKAGKVAIPPAFDSGSAFQEGRAVARVGTKLGYLDKTGAWAVPAVYDGAMPFAEGLAAVMRRREVETRNAEGRVMKKSIVDGWGYIDAAGRETIPLEYGEAKPFSEGLALVRRDGRRGYIDKTGTMLFTVPDKGSAGPFKSGLACVELGLRTGYIDATGNRIISPRFTSAGPFSEGLARVTEPARDGLSGYIGPDGLYAIPPKYDIASDFHHGLAEVKTGEQWALIDLTGHVAFGPQSNAICAHTESIIILRMSGANTRFRVLDRTGKPLPDGDFDFCMPYRDDRFMVSRGDKWGLLDGGGRLAVPLDYDGAGLTMGEDLMAVKKGGKFGFADMTGRLVIKPQFEDALIFTPQGTCPVKLGGKWGYVTRDGTMAIPPTFEDYVFPFAGKLAPVRVKGKWGFINPAGTFVVEPRFDRTGIAFQDGLIEVEERGKRGYMDENGTLAVPLLYDADSNVQGAFKGGLAPVKKGPQLGYIDTTGRIVWMSFVPKSENDRIIEDCTRLIAENPANAAAYVRRGRARMEQHDYETALPDLDKAALINPYNAEAPFLKGASLLALGRQEAARESYLKAADLGNTNALAALKSLSATPAVTPGAAAVPKPAKPLPSWDELVDAINDQAFARAAKMIEENPALATETDNKGWSALHVAAKSAKADPNHVLLKALLAAHADVNLKVKGGEHDVGNTPLLFAADSYSTEAIQMLLAAGADVDSRNEYRQTALHVAAHYGNMTIVNKLLALNATVDARDQFGETPLHTAVKSGKIEIVQLLIEKGADVDTRADGQTSPLHYCALSDKNAAMAELLLRNKANPNARDADGTTPLGWADPPRIDPDDDPFDLRGEPQQAMISLLRRYGGTK